MEKKYDPLTAALRTIAERGQDTVEWPFDYVEELVGDLPPWSARRQWWANDSKSQARAWRAADFHVAAVDLPGRRVTFARGKVGGTSAAGRRTTSNPTQQQLATVPAGTPVEAVEVRIHFQWLDAGSISGGYRGKPRFGEIEAAPGVYRMSLTGGPLSERPRIYIGESGDLRKRLVSNYGNGSGGTTTKRIHARLRDHLAAGGQVHLMVSTAATVLIEEVEHPLDLKSKAGRLLAENAALVLERIADRADFENLP